MLLAFILGAAAAYVAPLADDPIKRALGAALMAEARLSPLEWRMISFALCLLGAAILASLIGNGSGVALTFGALVGVFVPRLIARYRTR